MQYNYCETTLKYFNLELWLRNIKFVKTFEIMQTLTEVQSQIDEAKKKKKDFMLSILDGRTQKSIAIKAGIDNTKLSKWVNGTTTLEDAELDRLEEILGTNLR